MNLELSPLGTEALDSPSCAPNVARATLRDIARCNALFGGRAAVAFGLHQLVEQSHARSAVTVLDVGAGSGDVISFLARRSRHARTRIHPIALDWHGEATLLCREANIPSVRGDVGALPVRDHSVDVVVASQLLHHYTRPVAIALIRTFTRIARLGVVVADLRRARRAMWGIRFASFALNFHPATRHDGVLSVQRGFSHREFMELFQNANVSATVHRRPGFRLVAICTGRHVHD